MQLLTPILPSSGCSYCLQAIYNLNKLPRKLSPWEIMAAHSCQLWQRGMENGVCNVDHQDKEAI